MATTNTVTSPAAGQTVYSFTALAVGDTFDIDASSAHSILWQTTAGTFGGSTVALVGSLDGATWAPLFQASQPITGVAVTTAVQATAANQAVWVVQPTRYLRVQVTGGAGAGIQCTVLLRTL